MTNEEKLKEVLNFHWKGFMEYDEMDEVDKYDRKKEYSIQELYNALKDAYNLGIELASEKTRLLWVREGDTEYWVEVDKESILKLKIK